MKREVWRRDGARCAFVGATGRCSERGFLELHHVMPFAAGGDATAANIELRCRAHNAYEAARFFGSFTVREHPPAYNSFQTELENWHDRPALRRTVRRGHRPTRTALHSMASTRRWEGRQKWTVLHPDRHLSQNDDASSEREKMLVGEQCDPLDAELAAARVRTRDLCLALNATREADEAQRRGDWFGTGGDG